MIGPVERPPKGLFITLFLAYALGLVALCWPAWVGFGDVVIGHADSDVWKHLWGDAWFYRELGVQFPVPIETRDIGFPDGGLLYNLDAIGGIFAFVFAPLMGLVGAHTLGVTLALAAGGLSAAYLSWRLCGDAAAASVAGAIYAFSAQLQCLTLASGVSETAHIAWLPLSLVATLDICQRQRPWGIAVGAPSLFLAALGSWYYGLVSAIAVVGLFVWYGRYAGWSRLQWRRAALRLLLMSGLALVAILPFAWIFLESIRATEALNNVASTGVSHRDLMPRFNGAVVTLWDLVLPRNPRINEVRDWLIFSNHPGFVALGLAAFTIIGRSRLAIGLLLAGALSLAVGFGPVVHVDRVTEFLPNPVFLISEQLPVLAMIRNLERFQVPFTLCISIVAAIGLTRILSFFDLGIWSRRALAGGLALLAVADAWYVSGLPYPLPTADARIPTAYESLRSEAGEFAIIELPITFDPAGQAFWYQTHHRRPLPLNLEGALAPSLRDNPLMLQIIGPSQVNLYLEDGAKVDLTPGGLETGRQALVELGFRYILLNERGDGRDKAEVDRLRPILQATLGDAVRSEGGIEIFALGDRGGGP